MDGRWPLTFVKFAGFWRTQHVHNPYTMRMYDFVGGVVNFLMVTWQNASASRLNVVRGNHAPYLLYSHKASKMPNFLSRTISQQLPLRYVPKGTKNVNGTRLPLTSLERREFFERNLDHQIQAFLNRYSPVRKLAKRIKTLRVKVAQKSLYANVGQVALLHAAIEQSLKETLINDCGIPREFNEAKLDNNGREKVDADGYVEQGIVRIERLYGERLQKRFLKSLKVGNAPSKFTTSYREHFKRLDKLSQKRNAFVKTRYSFDQENASIRRVSIFDMKNPESLSDWIKPISAREFEELTRDLMQLARDFEMLRFQVSKDKHQLFDILFSKEKSIPSLAFSNPYIFADDVK